MKPRLSIHNALALLAAALLSPAVGHATNGMYLTGYDAGTIGRAGANLAIGDTPLAFNVNPAALCELDGRQVSVDLSILAPSLTFSNGLNRNVDAESRYFPLPAVAYVRAERDSRWIWGIGLIAQGGLGATFEDLNTPFGTKDETHSQVRCASITPTIAYRINDDMGLGAALNIGYADASFRFYPRTSFFNRMDPANSFFGVDLHQAAGPQISARLGWWWRASDHVSFGAAYQTKTDATFDGGDLTVNFENHPLLQRKVHYQAEVEGFTFAAQAGVGIAVRPNPRWTVAADVKRYFWDDAIDTIRVRGEKPKESGAPRTIDLPFVFNWKDQWVFATGADYQATDALTLRAGYNYGSNPVPSDTLTPLFPATVEHHVSAGAAWHRDGRIYELSIERATNERVTNNNPDPRVNPFGPGASVEHAQWTLSLGMTWILGK